MNSHLDPKVSFNFQIIKKTLIKVSAILLLSISYNGLALADAGLHELIQQATHKVSTDIHNYEGFLERAVLHIRQGDMKSAMNDIRQAENASDKTEVAYLYGMYHIAQSNYPAAITKFNEHLTRYPGHMPSIRSRSIAHKELGLIDHVIWDFHYLLNVSQSPSPDYYLELARLEATNKPYGIDLALKTLDRGLDKLGLLVSLQTVAIQYEVMKGDYLKALKRHTTLKQWLGRTEQWQIRDKELSKALSTADRKIFMALE